MERCLLFHSPLEPDFFAAQYVEWSGYRGEIWTKSAVVSHEPQEGLHFLGASGSLPIPAGRYLGWIRGYTVLANHMPQIVYLSLK